MEFEVNIRPHGKQRPRVCKNGITFTPKKTLDNEKLIRLAFIQSKCSKLEGNLNVEITAIFAPNKSETKKNKALQITGIPYNKKPDIDNICKEVLDALNGMAWNDDASVVKLSGEKRYGSEDKLIIKIDQY